MLTALLKTVSYLPSEDLTKVLQVSLAIPFFSLFSCDFLPRESVLNADSFASLSLSRTFLSPPSSDRSSPRETTPLSSSEPFNWWNSSSPSSLKSTEPRSDEKE